MTLPSGGVDNTYEKVYQFQLSFLRKLSALSWTLAQPVLTKTIGRTEFLPAEEDAFSKVCDAHARLVDGLGITQDQKV
jgi:hypothetical protein